MKRIILSVGIIALVLFAVVGISYNLISAEPSLFIHLRCKGEVSGKLSVAMILPNGELANSKSYDIKSVCETGKIEFDEYDKENRSLQFTFESSDGQNSKIISEYGTDILRDPNEYNMILSITDNPPFIANDRL